MVTTGGDPVGWGLIGWDKIHRSRNRRAWEDF